MSDLNMPMTTQLPNRALPTPGSKEARTARSDRRIHEIGQQFEAVFINTMLDQMQAGDQTPEVGGGGQAEHMYRSMLNEQIANQVSKRGGLGIAQHIETQLKRYQENAK